MRYKEKWWAARSGRSDHHVALTYSTSLNLDFPFCSSRTWAGRSIGGGEPLERAQASGYKQGAQQAEDGIKDNTEYVKKTPQARSARGRTEMSTDYGLRSEASAWSRSTRAMTISASIVGLASSRRDPEHLPRRPRSHLLTLLPTTFRRMY